MARVLSEQAAEVLRLFLGAPDRPRYGREIIVATGLKSGSLYPMLHRLDAAGLLRCEWESLEIATATGRRPRALYWLKDERRAQAMVERFEQSRSGAGVRPRTAPA